MNDTPPVACERPAAAAVANIIQHDLLAMERHIDEALSRAHQIGQNLASGRLTANLSATFGQSMFDDIAGVVSRTTQLRAEVVQAHHRMDRHAKRLGVKPVSSGLEKPPTKDGIESPYPKTGVLPAVAD